MRYMVPTEHEPRGPHLSDIHTTYIGLGTRYTSWNVRGKKWIATQRRRINYINYTLISSLGFRYILLDSTSIKVMQAIIFRRRLFAAVHEVYSQSGKPKEPVLRSASLRFRLPIRGRT